MFYKNYFSKIYIFNMIVKIPFKKENINKYIDIFYFISV